MALTVFLVFACISIVAINIIGSITVLKSKLYSSNKKLSYLLLIWFIPVLGAISTILLVSHDMKILKKKSDEELVDALNNFTSRVTTISEGIKKKRKDKSMH